MLKNLFKLLTLLLVPGIAACADDFNAGDVSSPPEESQPGMQRIIVATPMAINDLISSCTGTAKSRTLAMEPCLSNNDEEFVSLLEANKRKVMASLSPSQLDSLKNDPDELEFALSDSVIADFRFAQLLNANREIQVGQTIYKYYPNGVATVNARYASELNTIGNSPSKIKVTPENEGSTIPISPNVSFTLVSYQSTISGEEPSHPQADGSSTNNSHNGGYYGNGSTTSNNTNDGNNPPPTTAYSTGSSIILSNGVTIQPNYIREIDYDSPGDGNWAHYIVGRMWGRNIVAINKFGKDTKLTMNFYDQNYIVYANIGTELKMQKKVCGIWWNIKADELVQGWETFTLEYTFPKPVPVKPHETFMYDGMNKPTVTASHPFPFSATNIVLFQIPYIDYNFTSKDLVKTFSNMVKWTFNQASAWAKSKVGSEKNMGLFCFNDNKGYIINGPYSTSVKNKKTLESKFYAKLFPGTFELTFSLNNSFNVKNIKFDTNDGVALHQGSVFGAINYKGTWLAARIIKYSK